MSAAAPQQIPAPGEEAPQKKRRWRLFRRRSAEQGAEEQPAGEDRPRRRWFRRSKTHEEVPHRRPTRSSPSIAFYLTLFAILTGVAAVALVYRADLVPGLPPAPADSTEPAAEAPQTGPTPEQLERAVELARQQAELAVLQTQLAEREAAVQEKEAQVNQVLQELSGAGRRDVALNRTARLLTEMPPYRAASLLAEMDDDTAVAILKRMTTDEAATILAAMEADRAADLLQAYAEEA